MQNIVLIGDERIKAIPVQGRGEPLVDLLKDFLQLAFDQTRANVRSDAKSISFLHRTPAYMLVSAQENLPKGIKLLIKECHRPVSLQAKYWNDYSDKMKLQHQDWSEQQINSECSKFVAPPDVAPHSTGGAVDLTLTNEEGIWLDMGTGFNASLIETANATYTEANNISETARTNRQMLVQAMVSAGFVNYPTEWWHWSYGDKYWAFCKQQKYALFSSVGA